MAYKRLTSESNRYYTREQEEILVRLFRKGKTVEEIADELGRTKTSVSTKISNMRKNGIPVDRTW